MRDPNALITEKTIRKQLVDNMNKRVHPGTKPSIDFIKHILDQAYESGIPYDVSDLQPDIFSFAMDSTHHARYCMKVVGEMKFMSEEMELQTIADSEQLVFYDVEVFPNLLVICYKFAGNDNVVRLINPSPAECEELMTHRLVGFNCRRYDNHIIYARAQGFSIEQIYDISQRIINNDRSGMFGAAYDVSYTDIYDFSSKKQSLKKFEIELGLHHLELGLPWDQPVPEELWIQVTEYCANDVIATEATFEARQPDFVARQILAELSGLSVNASTQMHTARILFGTNKKPQKEFVYTDLSEMFEGYEYDFGKSTYRGEVVGEGGYVYSEPGYYKNVVLLDVASMHPTSILMLNAFGPYTEKFSDLLTARLAIKRKDYEAARHMLDGRLAPYLKEEEQAEQLSYALKIVINIVYGLTSAKFENAFRDPRNKDNIVAKRGALFMIELKHVCQEKGLKVVHIKTDSIKIPDATDEDIAEIIAFGAKYGYDFEHEATYDQFVLFNDAVYIAHDPEKGWSATGAQFQHPYVFKTLLGNEPTTFEDLLETKNVTGKGSIHIITPESDRFVGRIGQFVPVVEGVGGGALMRVVEENGERKESHVSGTKGYLWMEAETVRNAGLEEKVDMCYYAELIDKAQAEFDRVGFAL